MAKVRKNIITQGLSGKIGDLLVFRQVGDETIVTKAPERENYAPSPAQQKQVNRFQQAIHYAKRAMQNESLKASYQQRAQGNRNAFNIAIADFLNAPVIEAIDTNNYQGKKGSRLTAKVTDDHQVAEVTISIFQADEMLLEEGVATPHKNGKDWSYTTQKSLPAFQGSLLQIRATDLAGNVAVRELLLV